MVRIVSLVAVLVSCLSSVLALETGTYWIKNYSAFMTEASSHRIYTTYAPSSTGQQWYVEKQEDGTFTIKNLSYGSYAYAIADEPGAPVVGMDEPYMFALEELTGSGSDPIYAIRSAAVQLYVAPLNGVGSDVVLQPEITGWVFYENFPGMELKAH